MSTVSSPLAGSKPVILSTAEQAEPAASWRIVWRAFAALFSDAALATLAEALRADDSRVIHGATCEPSPSMGNATLPVCRVCAVGFLAHADGAHSVGELEERFADACASVDVAMGEPTACRRFLNFWDSANPAKARRQLLAEIERTLSAR